MLKGLKLVTGTVLVMMMVSAALAQRPRTVPQDAPADAKSMPTPPPAPEKVNAKYEGGVFGYSKKKEGTLHFDELNQRLVFKDSKQKELLFVPYNAITGAYADTHSVRPAAATVAVNGNQQFSASVCSAANSGVMWSVNGVRGGSAVVGTISEGGLYTAPGAVPSPNRVTVSAASIADASKSASAEITIISLG